VEYISITLDLGIRARFLIGQAAEGAFENLLLYARCPVGRPGEEHYMTAMLAFHSIRNLIVPNIIAFA